MLGQSGVVLSATVVASQTRVLQGVLHVSTQMRSRVCGILSKRSFVCVMNSSVTSGHLERGADIGSQVLHKANFACYCMQGTLRAARNLSVCPAVRQVVFAPPIRHETSVKSMRLIFSISHLLR